MFVTRPREPDRFVGEPFPRPGVRVRLRADPPPWMVVGREVGRLLTAWPFRLWSVSDIDRNPAQSPGDEYTQVSAFTVVEELDAWITFGNLGWRVASILDRAELLDVDDVAALAEAVTPADESDAYNQAHVRWADAVARPDGQGNLASAGWGYYDAYRAVERAARKLDDPQAFAYDTVDGVWFLTGNWQKAAHAAMYAVMAFGSPSLLANQEEVELLSTAWRSRFGEPPTSPPTLNSAG